MAPPTIPPSLPPSVEEAYRHKCVQLKNRTSEVEDANDAARLRLARIKRQVEKLRIERAFLLEQLTKRTSTNVEDSDGSPSPPPTDSQQFATSSEVDANPRKPKDRPLRTKRGHRKQDVAGDNEKPPASGSFTAGQPPSPSSETFSTRAESRANGVSGSSAAAGDAKRKPADGFELYAAETRPSLEDKKKDDDDDDDDDNNEDLNIEEELEKGCKNLSDSAKEEYQTKANEKAANETNKESSVPPKKDNKPSSAEKDDAQNEDVEMGNYDTEDQETQAEEKADD